MIMKTVLDLTAKQSEKTVKSQLNSPVRLFNAHEGYSALEKISSRLVQTVSLKNGEGQQLTLLNLESRELKYHPMVHENFSKSKYLEKVLATVTEHKPKTYEELVALQGVGPKTVRALALVGEVIYGAKRILQKLPARLQL